MIGVWRYTTVRCVRVWKFYTVYSKPLVAAAAIGCGGFVAGQPLPAAPVPYIAPYVAPLLPPEALFLPPDVAPLVPDVGSPYFPPGYAGYEPGAVGVFLPSVRIAPSAPRHGSGSSAGGVTPDVSSVGPCCIQPRTTDHLYSPPDALMPTPGFPAAVPDKPTPVPEPPAWMMFATALSVLAGLRVLTRRPDPELRGANGLVGWALISTPWPVAVWWLV